MTIEQWNEFVSYCQRRIEGAKEGFALQDYELEELLGITHPFYEKMNEFGLAQHPGFNTNFSWWDTQGQPTRIHVSLPQEASEGTSTPPVNKKQ